MNAVADRWGDSLVRALRARVAIVCVLLGGGSSAADEPEAGWKEIHRDGELRIELQDAEPSPRIRGVTRLPYPAASVRAALLDLERFADWVPGLVEWRLLSADGSGAVVYGRHDLPFPLADRDYVVRYAWQDGDRFVLEARSTDEAPQETPEGVVRLSDVHTVWEVERAEAGTSRVVYRFEGDLGGAVPQALLRWTWAGQAVDAFEGLAAQVAAAPPAPDVDERLLALASGDPDAIEDVLRGLASEPDARFAAPLIELLRAEEMGIAGGFDRRDLVRALESVTGESFGPDWPAWVRWYSGTSLEPPTGFTGWKGSLLARVDPRFARLLPYGAPARVRVEEIVWGGVAFEGIPALEAPATLAADEASYLDPDEPVFGIALGGEARAYPLRILDWHEMANDELGGVPFSLAYCTLCGAGIAYDRRAPDGAVYDFGSSGFLMRSNKLMVDRQTGSLWNQFTGRPVVGPLAEADLSLSVLPSVVTTWSDWRARHPETRVLSLDTGFDRPYEPGAAYADYFASSGLMFPVRELSRALPPKARVFGLEIDGLPKAYALDHLTGEGVLNDRVGPVDVVLVAPHDAIAVAGRSVRMDVPRSYSTGAPVRAFRRGGRSFASGPDPQTLLDEDGTTWKVTEEALVAADGERLPRQPGVLSYWFAWSSYHPRTALVGASGAGASRSPDR